MADCSMTKEDEKFIDVEIALGGYNSSNSLLSGYCCPYYSHKNYIENGKEIIGIEEEKSSMKLVTPG